MPHNANVDDAANERLFEGIENVAVQDKSERVLRDIGDLLHDWSTLILLTRLL